MHFRKIGIRLGICFRKISGRSGILGEPEKSSHF